MFQVISCLLNDHDYAFVVVAAIVCVAGSAMTMRLFDRTGGIASETKLGWIVLAGIACGSAIWTTHFVAMLGFKPPFEHAFNPFPTIASLLMAIAFTACGLYLAAFGRGNHSAEMGGAVIGLGIVSMHFTGMFGFEVPGRIVWDPELVLSSVMSAVALGAFAMHAATRTPALAYSKVLSVGAMVLAICTMHFTAMGAATIVPDPLIEVSSTGLSREFLAVIVLATMATLTGITLYLMDARCQRDMVDTLRHAAMHDPLTGLPNRAFLADKLPTLLRRSDEGDKKTAIIVVDLDRFKEINDVHGHHTGDVLLQTLSDRMRTMSRDGELIARVGGDEFVAIKQDVSSQADIDEFVRRLVESCVDPVCANAQLLTVGASVGVSVYPDHASSLDDLIGAADLAMYRAKRSAFDKICYYDRALDEGRRRRSAVAIELRHAIERDEFELYYQPQHDVSTGEVTAYEALLRWNHYEHGAGGPAEFIPVAEENGLIIPIGNWVLKAACADAAKWRKPYKVCVNIAPAQLIQSDLPKLVHETLLSTGLPASRLELEITEAGLIEDQERALHVVRQLKALGVSIAMDDYGAGYSSLVTLQIFPFDKVKIDRSFIKDVATNTASAAIVRATILLANQLRIPVLAEGVEKHENLEFLRAEGCVAMQGFLFGKPQPLSQISWVVDPAGAAGEALPGEVEHRERRDGIGKQSAA